MGLVTIYKRFIHNPPEEGGERYNQLCSREVAEYLRYNTDIKTFKGVMTYFPSYESPTKTHQR